MEEIKKDLEVLELEERLEMVQMSEPSVCGPAPTED
jgi:hypothetical protein